MKTVPLYGKVAAGRVALVDDTDYAFVMLYRWNVWELPRPGRYPQGPYATTNYRKPDGGYATIRMHTLIMGAKGIDHINHNGLDNRRSNLRRSTRAQNNRNTRPMLGKTSQYKGVHWKRKEERWCAAIYEDGQRYQLGIFISELEAAYAYDAAARTRFGEFACTNFTEGPAQALRDQWEAERARLRTLANRQRGRSISASWEHRAAEVRACERCGTEYESKSHNSRYCGMRCRRMADYYRQKEARERETERSLP